MDLKKNIKNECFVDNSNGTLIFDKKNLISNKIKIENLISMGYKDKFSEFGFDKITAKKVDFGGIYFDVEFVFKNKNLTRIYFIMSNEKEQLIKIWTDYKEDNIESKKEKYDKWLDICLLGKRKFKWGVIEAVVEKKMWNTVLILDYKLLK
ncbi:hypothetical protein JE952_002467 [Flavobacterium psychrophilum]|nr:hypothetical protein [Flavobacterium psychrophilum]